MKINKNIYIVSFLLFFFLSGSSSWAQNKTLDNLNSRPQRIVSLVPAATEVIHELGLAELLVGVTYKDLITNYDKTILVGGVLSPQAKLIKTLNPRLIILTEKQANDPNLKGDWEIFLWNSKSKHQENEQQIISLGKLLKKEKETQILIDKNQEKIKLIAQKTNKIKPENKKRVIQIMGNVSALTPGDYSFQNELITLAGGISPILFKNTPEVELTLKDWKQFNPQVIIACPENKKTMLKLEKSDEWKQVLAFQNKEIYYFPCNLMQNSSINNGDFISWLAASLYDDQFSQKDFQVYPNEIINIKNLKIDLPYVKEAKIVETRLYDFNHRTLLIDFKKEQNVLSTYNGFENKIKTIGNSHSPVTMWGIHHKLGFDSFRENLYQTLKINEAQSSLIFTGADLNNLSLKKVSYHDLEVTVLITAGTRGNAIRSSKDSGAFIETENLGTINIILLTNHKLSSQALTRALITVTEAKTAALWDLDIRSSQSPLYNPATGTGTDDIIVVEGQGSMITNVGGHAKMGELIAEAVYQGVTEAILKQNKIITKRNIFQRLEERGILISDLIENLSYKNEDDFLKIQEIVETEIFKQESFLQAALNLSDAHIMGNFTDLEIFNKWALKTASEIAQKDISSLDELITDDKLPPVVKIALNAFFTGINKKENIN